MLSVCDVILYVPEKCHNIREDFPTGWPITLLKTSHWLQNKVPFWPGQVRTGQNGTFVLKSTGGFKQRDGSPCNPTSSSDARISQPINQMNNTGWPITLFKTSRWLQNKSSVLACPDLAKPNGTFALKSTRGFKQRWQRLRFNQLWQLQICNQLHNLNYFLLLPQQFGLV